MKAFLLTATMLAAVPALAAEPVEDSTAVGRSLTDPTRVVVIDLYDHEDGSFVVYRQDINFVPAVRCEGRSEAVDLIDIASNGKTGTISVDFADLDATCDVGSAPPSEIFAECRANDGLYFRTVQQVVRDGVRNPKHTDTYTTADCLIVVDGEEFDGSGQLRRKDGPPLATP